ncbi:hypothetical protein H744_2c0282 [Photobacterium gaetbulicola Gung47]|uniref:Uncharacterized protein n=1 Tax=Photobacterium gaetbulicola Gung47 TaxID=658445 RepID=A0A0C5W683_9GAMM|nr:hypothetical protein H744_2c0282 [Photobacterium gaetbulicola Gung47]
MNTVSLQEGLSDLVHKQKTKPKLRFLGLAQQFNGGLPGRFRIAGHNPVHHPLVQLQLQQFLPGDHPEIAFEYRFEQVAERADEMIARRKINQLMVAGIDVNPTFLIELLAQGMHLRHQATELLAINLVGIEGGQCRGLWLQGDPDPLEFRYQITLLLEIKPGQQVLIQVIPIALRQHPGADTRTGQYHPLGREHFDCFSNRGSAYPVHFAQFHFPRQNITRCRFSAQDLLSY